MEGGKLGERGGEQHIKETQLTTEWFLKGSNERRNNPKQCAYPRFLLQGATVLREPDTGYIIVARILHGGVVDRSGKK